MSGARTATSRGISSTEVFQTTSSSTSISSSSRFILDLGPGQHALADAVIQEALGHEVHRAPAEQARELLFHAVERDEAWDVFRVELHQHIDVTVRPEVLAQDRPEQRQLADMTTLAEVGQRSAVDGNPYRHERILARSNAPSTPREEPRPTPYPPPAPRTPRTPARVPPPAPPRRAHRPAASRPRRGTPRPRASATAAPPARRSPTRTPRPAPPARAPTPARAPSAPASAASARARTAPSTPPPAPRRPRAAPRPRRRTGAPARR